MSLLSRKFTYWARLPPFSLSALMQLPSANRERLMWAPSFILLPRFWVWVGEEEVHTMHGPPSHPSSLLSRQPGAWG